MSFLRRNMSTFFGMVASQRLSTVSSLTNSFWILAGLVGWDSIVRTIRMVRFCMVQLVQLVQLVCRFWYFYIFLASLRYDRFCNEKRVAESSTNDFQRLTLSGPIETATSKFDLRDNMLNFWFTPQTSAAWTALMYARLYPLSSLSTVLCFKWFLTMSPVTWALARSPARVKPARTADLIEL